MKYLIPVVAAVALSGCAMLPQGTVNPNAEIAKVSAKLAKNCFLLQTVLGGVSVYSSDAKLVKAANEANAVVASFCQNPPNDIPSALVATEKAYLAFIAAEKSQ